MPECLAVRPKSIMEMPVWKRVEHHKYEYVHLPGQQMPSMHSELETCGPINDASRGASQIRIAAEEGFETTLSELAVREKTVSASMCLEAHQFSVRTMIPQRPLVYAMCQVVMRFRFYQLERPFKDKSASYQVLDQEQRQKTMERPSPHARLVSARR